MSPRNLDVQPQPQKESRTRKQRPQPGVQLDIGIDKGMDGSVILVVAKP
jgi:hypothetical protein